LSNSSSGLSFKISSFVSNNKIINIIFHPKPGIFGDALIYVIVSDEGNCGDIKKPKVVLTSNTTEILTVSPQFLVPLFQFSSSNMNISYALNFSLPSVQIFNDLQGKLLSVNISFMNEESDSLLYSNISKGKYVTFTSKNPKELESFISKVKYFTTDKREQLDLLLFNLSNSVYSSHRIIKVFKKLDKINPFNESMNIITLRRILNSNIFPGILSNDFVMQQEKCHLKMVCSCCSFIRIGMTESLRSGVDYFYSNSIALKELKLVGFPLQIEKAIQFIDYKFNLTCGLSDRVSLSLNASSLGSYSANLEIVFEGNLFEGYSFDSTSKDSNLFLPVQENSILSLPEIKINAPRFDKSASLRDDDHVLRLNVRSLNEMGDIVSLSNKSQDISPDVIYQLNITELSKPSPEIQKVIFDVNWKYERQMITFNVKDMELISGAEISISFTYGGYTDSGKFSLSASHESVVESVKSLLKSLTNFCVLKFTLMKKEIMIIIMTL
jgi:hypothetical protein